MPELGATVSHGRISRLEVFRGAPCGATWEAAKKVIGMQPDEAVTRMGLEVQFFCSADPAGWDPMYGKSPVHLAGKLHSAALKKALSLLVREGSGISS